MGIREEFEELEEVAARIGCGIYWNEYQQKYQTDLSNLFQTVCYLNGAWYVFQEQQKKIDAIKSKLSDIYDASDEDETVAHLLDEIQELLK